MESFDLAVAWTWAPDVEFVRLLEKAVDARDARFLRIGTDNVRRTLHALQEGTLQISRILDRASDENEEFAPLARWVRERSQARDPTAPRPWNPHDLMVRAADKATMHLEFLSAGLAVPHTVILPPAAIHPQATVTRADIGSLGIPFVVKPANTTGGGNGVVMGVRSVEAVTAIRRSHPGDKYLLQETIRPAYLGDFRAWFRVFYVCGDVIPCWWDDQTHVYEEVSAEDERYFALDRVHAAVRTIANVCRLDFFSTELAHTPDGRLVAVDYVNEMCDMRVQSSTPNGVPDAVVQRIADRIAALSVGSTYS